MRRFRGVAVALALAAGATGCAALFGGYGRGPDGLPDADREVRRLLVAGRLAPDSANGPLPDDELLRALYLATLDLQAGRPGRSAEALDRALALTEDRYTRSVSRTALSLLASDRVVPWEPLPTERLLIHYYAARAWLAQGLPDEAAVEARRLSVLLDRLEEEEDDAEPRLRTFLRQFAGVVFEAAGEANDAEVAYRKAARAAGGGASSEGAVTADSAVDDASAPFRLAPPQPPPGWGEVVLLVERGFVAHKVEEAIHVTLPGDDVDGLSREGDERGALALEIAGVVARIAGGPSLYRDDRAPVTRWVDLTDRPRRAAAREAEECREPDGRPAGEGKPTARPGGPPPGIPLPGSVLAPAPAGATTRAGDEKPRKQPKDEQDEEDAENDGECEEERDRNPYLLRIAWPAFREGPPTYGRLALEVDEAPRDAAWRTVDLTSPLVDDFGEGREWLLARTLARAAAKAALTRGLERKVGEKDEVAGRIVGILANAGTALLERADTRSWHLLPRSLTLTRIALPPGSHRLAVGVEGAGSAAEPLPPVEVRSGELVVVGTRIWK